MANDLSLKVLIETIAKGNGITVTTEQTAQLVATYEKATTAGKSLEISTQKIEEDLRALTTTTAKAIESQQQVTQTAEGMARQFAEANAKTEEWGRTIKGLTNDQLLDLEEQLRKEIRTQQALGQSTDDLKRKLEETFSARTAQQAEATFKAGERGAQSFTKAGQQLTAELSRSQRGLQGINQAIEGLNRGGLAGLTQAARGGATAVGALATGALGTVLLPALATAGAALFAMQKRAESNEAALKKMFDGAAAGAKTYEESVKAMQTETDARIEAHLEQVSRLLAAYNELAGLQSRASARVADQNSARRELELAGARTPEERDAIERRYATVELDNRQLSAQLEREAAEELARNLRSELNAVNAAAEQQRKEYEDALSFTTDLGGRTDRDAVELRKRAQAAKAAYDDAAAKASQLRESILSELSRTEDAIRDATSAIQTTGIRQQALELQPTGTRQNGSAGQPSTSSPGSPRNLDAADQQISDIRSALQSAEERAFRSPGLGAGQREVEALKGRLAEAEATRNSLYNQIAADAEAQARKNRQVQQQLRTIQETSAP